LYSASISCSINVRQLNGATVHSVQNNSYINFGIYLTKVKVDGEHCRSLDHHAPSGGDVSISRTPEIFII